MAAETQSDIADILGAIASGPMVKESKVDQVLRHMSKVGIPLSICSDDRHLARAVSTLKRRARRLDLVFPDYCPRHLKPKKAKAPKRRRASV